MICMLTKEMEWSFFFIKKNQFVFLTGYEKLMDCFFFVSRFLNGNHCLTKKMKSHNLHLLNNDSDFFLLTRIFFL